MILHIVNKAALFASCLRFAGPDDVILCIENGVYATLAGNEQLSNGLKTCRIYALDEDITARGLHPNVHPAINLVNYAGFVDLVVDHPVTQTWY